MRLKKLEIRGFKTFADVTQVDFTPGITAVVGPNGSGKSNISDAIAWVMGESNVRNLRAQKTEDVIFNGSAKRKPLGFAEVSLTIDNASGRLPLGFEEITVTRRAYRSGDSEYLINKVPCRLRDIFELFLDSGAGRGAYSMVSQGEIDRLLTSKAEDRRELLEEAAGVKKYRHRRHETYRKLEHTKDNLSRVDDIMQELQGQLGPLAEQAETAIRYKELTERLREIEVGLLVSRVQKLNDDINEWKLTEESVASQIADNDTLMVELTQLESEAAEKHQKAQRSLEEQYSQFSAAQSVAERLRSDLAVAEARKQSTEEGRQRIAEDISRLNLRLADLKEQLSIAESDSEDVAIRKSEFLAEVERLKPSVTALADEIRDLEKKLVEEESGARSLAEDKAAQRTRLQAAYERINLLSVEQQAANERLAGIDARAAERQKERDQSLSAAEELQSRLQVLEAEITSLRTTQEELKSNLESAQLADQDTTREIVSHNSRLKMLKELEEARDGYFAGVKSILAAVKRGELPKDYAAVADILDVPSDLDIAIEAALGSALQDIATSSFENARIAIEYLKSRNLGRATFLPMDRLERQDLFSSQSLRSSRGIIGIAYDLIGFDKFYDPVARLLLGRVLVAHDVNSAGDASRQLRGWSKIVTPEGELLVPSGAITGGSRQKKGIGLIERKREIADLTDDLKKLNDQQEHAKRAIEKLKADISENGAALFAMETEVTEARAELSRARAASDSADAALKEMEASRTELAGRLETSASQLEGLRGEVSALESMLADSGDTGEALDKMLDKKRRQLALQQEKHRQLQQQFNTATNQLSVYSERENAAHHNIRSITEELRRSEHALQVRLRESENLQETGGKSDVETGQLKIHLEKAQQTFDAARDSLTKAQELAHQLSDEHKIASQNLTEARESRDAMHDELHQLQISLTRGESEFNTSIERLWTEYEITKEDASSWPEALVVKHGTATEVNRLRREIREMGDVNTGAIAEFERVNERWEFYASQRTDLEEARDSLLEAIKEIDDSTRDLFMDTFNQVAHHFAEIFTTLFGGGEARLELTKPEDLLETGIEVIVQPPGKRLQNMDLLSGGEKALTAQALLFALMRVRPSPFCVMDEVDAPLDDANVGRFANLVKQFAENSQFIVITHNRATMEAADVLYGVTMSEPGISSLVSARLTD